MGLRGKRRQRFKVLTLDRPEEEEEEENSTCEVAEARKRLTFKVSGHLTSEDRVYEDRHGQRLGKRTGKRQEQQVRESPEQSRRVWVSSGRL